MKKLVSRLALIAMAATLFGLAGSSPANAGSYEFQATCGGVGNPSEPFIITNNSDAFPILTPGVFSSGMSKECEPTGFPYGLVAGNGFSGPFTVGDKGSLYYDVGLGARFTKVNYLSATTTGSARFSFGVRVESDTQQFVVAGPGGVVPSGIVTDEVIPFAKQGQRFKGFIECVVAPCEAGGNTARVQIGPRPKLTIDDHTPPIVAQTGSLNTSSWVSGVQNVTPVAIDGNSGIRLVWGMTNDQLVFLRVMDCNSLTGVVNKLSPCPNAYAPGSIPVDTGISPWVEGENSFKVCAINFATLDAGGIGCSPTRTVKVYR